VRRTVFFSCEEDVEEDVVVFDGVVDVLEVDVLSCVKQAKTPRERVLIEVCF
jgi:hypothetical protein